MYYMPVAPLGRKMGMKMPVVHWGDPSPILGAHWLSHIGIEELGSSGPHCAVCPAGPDIARPQNLSKISPALLKWQFSGSYPQQPRRLAEHQLLRVFPSLPKSSTGGGLESCLVKMSAGGLMIKDSRCLAETLVSRRTQVREAGGRWKGEWGSGDSCLLNPG